MSHKERLPIFLDNDNVIQIAELLDAVTSVFVNSGATVSLSITNMQDSDVSGLTFPTSMTLVESTNATYRRVVDKALEVTADENYKAVVTVVWGTVDAKTVIGLVARTREV